MIRFAEAGDRLRVVSLLRDSHAAAGFTFPFKAAYAEALFKAHADDDSACCIVFAPDSRPEGVLMARAFLHPFGAGLWAKETVWWIDSSHRGRNGFRMLAAYEDWARSKGCVSIGMASLAANDVSSIYQRCGYVAAETHFVKAL
jgi:GNAT superfamily N-acetyltransferase